MTDAKTRVDDEIAHYKHIQSELSELGGTRQQLVTQMNENGMVKEELALLEDGAPVYKLIGPALVKQDLTEARSDIERRMEFIKNETERALKKYEEKEAEGVAVRETIMKIQQEMQSSAAAAAQQAAIEASGGQA